MSTGEPGRVRLLIRPPPSPFVVVSCVFSGSVVERSGSVFVPHRLDSETAHRGGLGLAPSLARACDTLCFSLFVPAAVRFSFMRPPPLTPRPELLQALRPRLQVMHW